MLDTGVGLQCKHIVGDLLFSLFQFLVQDWVSMAPSLKCVVPEIVLLMQPHATRKPMLWSGDMSSLSILIERLPTQPSHTVSGKHQTWYKISASLTLPSLERSFPFLIHISLHLVLGMNWFGPDTCPRLRWILKGTETGDKPTHWGHFSHLSAGSNSNTETKPSVWQSREPPAMRE